MDSKIIDLNHRRVADFIEKMRPSIEMRNEIDNGYKFEKQAFELFTTRPIWDRKNEYRNYAFAKIKFIKSKKLWKLYWMRASGKWELYEPLPSSKNIGELLDCIEKDEYGCFLG